MNLTSDHPYWGICNGLVASYPSLTEDLRCECAVVGGGITGALVGFHLAKADIDTVVLDRRDIGTGSTSGSTGLLQYEVDVPLRELRARVGPDAANRSYLLCRGAIRKLASLIRANHLQCGFRLRPSLQMARFKSESTALETEHRLRRELGIRVSLWDETQITRHFPFARPAALFSEDGAEVDPHTLTHGLLAVGRQRGLRVFDRTQVTAISETRRGVRLRTRTGVTVAARRAVVAAGFESKEFLTQNSGQLKSTYAVVSEPVEDLSDWHRQCLIWETGIPYLYLRTLPDRRIIIGGEDEPFVNSLTRDALISDKARILKRKFNKLFPQIKFEVAYAWAGTFGQTKDGLPYIGRPKRHPHSYFALGYGGNGITYSLIAAEIIRDDFLGRANPDAAIFSFGR